MDLDPEPASARLRRMRVDLGLQPDGSYDADAAGRRSSDSSDESDTPGFDDLMGPDDLEESLAGLTTRSGDSVDIADELVQRATGRQIKVLSGQYAGQTGTLVKVNPKTVVLDIGGKITGNIPKASVVRDSFKPDRRRLTLPAGEGLARLGTCHAGFDRAPPTARRAPERTREEDARQIEALVERSIAAVRRRGWSDGSEWRPRCHCLWMPPEPGYHRGLWSRMTRTNITV